MPDTRNTLVFSDVMKDRLAEYATFPWILEILTVLGTAVIINLICYVINYLRLKLFKWLHIRQKLDLFENKKLK